MKQPNWLFYHFFTSFGSNHVNNIWINAFVHVCMLWCFNFIPFIWVVNHWFSPQFTSAFALAMRVADLWAIASPDFQISRGFSTMWRTHFWQGKLFDLICLSYLHDLCKGKLIEKSSTFWTHQTPKSCL